MNVNSTMIIKVYDKREIPACFIIDGKVVLLDENHKLWDRVCYSTTLDYELLIFNNCGNRGAQLPTMTGHRLEIRTQLYHTLKQEGIIQ